MTALWWVGWEEWNSPDDPRPLSFPPGPAVIASWCTGYGDGYATMVALVAAPDVEAVSGAIDRDWPLPKDSLQSTRTWRFLDRWDQRPIVLGDRFPMLEWSRARLEALGIEHDVEVARG